MPDDANGRVRHRTDAGPGRILALVASGEARTRSAIAQITGLSRPTVAQRLDALFAAGLLTESTAVLSSGGRPAKALAFNPTGAVVLCADIGEERTRTAVSDLSGEILGEDVEAIPLDHGPEPVLTRIAEVARGLLAELGYAEHQVAGFGVGVPAPVDVGTGRAVGWSVMGGWNGYDIYDIRERLRQEFGVPTFVDNDVNLLTLAEHRLWWPGEAHLLYVKAGTGIGSGIIADFHLNRGSLGAAGDIGHAFLSGHGDPPCRCGNRGCVESLAGG